MKKALLAVTLFSLCAVGAWAQTNGMIDITLPDGKVIHYVVPATWDAILAKAGAYFAVLYGVAKFLTNYGITKRLGKVGEVLQWICDHINLNNPPVPFTTNISGSDPTRPSEAVK